MVYESMKYVVIFVGARSAEDDSSSSNSSPSPRKLRSKLCHLAFGPRLRFCP